MTNDYWILCLIAQTDKYSCGFKLMATNYLLVIITKTAKTLKSLKIKSLSALSEKEQFWSVPLGIRKWSHLNKLLIVLIENSLSLYIYLLVQKLGISFFIFILFIAVWKAFIIAQTDPLANISVRIANSCSSSSYNLIIQIQTFGLCNAFNFI